MIVVGLSHRTAPVAIRERLALTGERLESALARIHGLPAVGEVMILSTCNRLEVYAVSSATEPFPAELGAQITELMAELGGTQVVPYLTSHGPEQAIVHLFRVASSLDSLVMGEPQILGQLKDAMRLAERLGTLGPELHAALHAALHVAKRVRNETAIGAGQVSVPSVAVTLARQIFDELRGRTALLVGAGEMAETAARLLGQSGAQVLVVNRSPERAERLATLVGGTPCAWAELEGALGRADIVITSTASPSHVITAAGLKAVRRTRRGRSLFLIDIAVPRDVDPAVHELDGVYLYDIDDLTKVVAQTLGSRAREADLAEQIVRAETARFDTRVAQRAVAPLIISMRERTRRTLETELARTLRGKLKHLGDEDRQALGMMLDAAVNKLLHEPATQLKAAAGLPQAPLVVQTVSQLFGLGEADSDESAEPVPSREQPREREEPAKDVEPRTALGTSHRTPP